jgi:hypothetical protein
MTDRHADAIAAVLADAANSTTLAAAKVQAIALAWVFQAITDETGRRSLQGQHPAQIAGEVRPIVADIIDDLDHWLTT